MKHYTNQIFTRIGIAFISACLAAPAVAQNTSDDAILEEIVVTAQKREQRLIDVPISMSVVSGATLEDLKITTIDELDRYIPNMWINESPGNATVYIRGIGTTPGNLAFDQSVVLFVDGVYGGRARQFMRPFMDVERVEVLRGPQGAVVGTNSSAGAISITTARPTKEFEGRIGAGYESEYGSYDVGGHFSGPISDNAQGRVAFRYEDFGGYLKNTVTGADEPESENLLLRASLAAQPTESIDINAKIEYAQFDTVGSAFQRSAPPTNPFDHQKEADGFGQPDRDENESTNVTLTMDFDLGENTLTSITAYSSYEFLKMINADQLPTDTWQTTFSEDYSQLSQELRLVSPSGNKVDYIVGLYYHSSDVDPLRAHSNYIFPLTFGPFVGTHEVLFRQESDMLSTFGNLTFNINDQWTIVGELRYTKEDKDARQDRDVLSGNAPPPWAAQTIIDSRSDTNTDPGLKIQWRPNASTMFYASYAEGSKSGGWQGNSRDLRIDTWTIEGESAKSYEIGVRSEFADGRGWITANYYDTEYEELQVSVWTGTTFATNNAAKATSSGIEVDGAFAFNDMWQLQGGLAYLDSTYDDFPGAPCRADEPGCDPATNNLAGAQLGWAPEWSGNLRLSFDQDVGDSLRIGGQAALLYRDEVWLSLSGNVGPSSTLQEATTWLDARLEFGAQDQSWTIALLGKNLTDEVTQAQDFAFPFPINASPGGTNKLTEIGRTFGVEAVLRF